MTQLPFGYRQRKIPGEGGSGVGVYLDLQDMDVYEVHYVHNACYSRSALTGHSTNMGITCRKRCPVYHTSIPLHGSRPQSTHRVEMATFWRIVNSITMEKSASLAGEGGGGGARPHVSIYLPSHIQSCGVRASWEGWYTPRTSTLPLHVLCGVNHRCQLKVSHCILHVNTYC